MKRLLLVLALLLPALLHAQDDHVFLQNQTFTHADLIIRYQRLAKKFPKLCRVVQAGPTDSGVPMHLVVVSRSGLFTPEKARKAGKLVVFINNGIHPGEPCGIDASYKLVADLCNGGKSALPENVVLCIVPIFNVDGALNRSCCSRANQNGPQEYGFRGNGQNLDLNRDFIKLDSRNAQTLVKTIRSWNPDIFIDTHTSNGADYPYVMTLITAQKDKAGLAEGTYMTEVMEPFLYQWMDSVKLPMCPYVNTMGNTPETGIADFLETPRFSTGYTSQFGTLGFVTEAHMLKPYPQRVIATLELLKAFIAFGNARSAEIQQLRSTFLQRFLAKPAHALNWQLDTTSKGQFNFTGYTATYKTSAVSGLPRLFYNQQEPYQKDIPWYRYFAGTDSIAIPKAYVIPQAWYRVIERLEWNGVHMRRFSADTSFTATVSVINSYQTTEKPYEGHYLHTQISVSRTSQKVEARAGDYYITVNQPAGRYITEVLEPNHGDSFFAWNFFDGILMQKEWFSSYVFEDHAAWLLENDEQLRSDFLTQKALSPEFTNNGFAQLYWIYQRSQNFETGLNRYPVVAIY
jgi:hypothetical protein